MAYEQKAVRTSEGTIYVDLSAAEITKRDLRAIASQARASEREAKQQARESAKSVLAAYDFDTAKTILEGEAIPSAAKAVLKQAFDIMKHLKNAGE